MDDENKVLKTGSDDKHAEMRMPVRAGEFVKGDSDVIDAEFSEEVKVPPPLTDDETEDEETIAAQPVLQPDVDDPLDKFFKDLPSETGAVSIVVTRRIDPKNASFRIPCLAEQHVGRLVWSGESPDEFHDSIRDTEGGGLYHFQMRYGKGFSNRTWTKLIADPAGPSLREKTLSAANANEHADARVRESSHIPAPAVATPPSEEEMLDKLMNRMERWNTFFLQLRPEPAPPPVAGPPPIAVKDQIALAMLPHINDPSLGPMVLKKIFGVTDPGGEKGWADVAWKAVENADQVIGIVGTVAPLVASFFGRRGPAPAQPPVRPGIVLPPAQQAPTPGIVMPPGAPAAETSPAAVETQPAAPVAQRKPVQAVKW